MDPIDTLLHLYQEIQAPEDDIEEMSSTPEVRTSRWVMDSYSDGVPEETPTQIEPYRTGQHQQLPPTRVQIALSDWEASRLEGLLEQLGTARSERPDVMRKILMLGVQSLEYSSAHFLPKPKPSLLDEP